MTLSATVKAPPLIFGGCYIVAEGLQLFETLLYVQLNVSNLDILRLSYGGQWRTYCRLARDLEDRYLMLSNVTSKTALGVGHFVSSGSLESNKVLVHYLHSRFRLWCSLLFIASND